MRAMSQAPSSTAPQAGAKADTKTTSKSRRRGSSRALWIFAIGALAVAGGIAWYVFSRPALPTGFATGNGRLEANQVYVASKYQGRIAEVLFNEGDTVQ